MKGAKRETGGQCRLGALRLRCGLVGVNVQCENFWRGNGEIGFEESLLLVCHVRLPLGTLSESSVKMWLCKDFRSPVYVSL